MEDEVKASICGDIRVQSIKFVEQLIEQVNKATEAKMNISDAETANSTNLKKGELD